MNVFVKPEKQNRTYAGSALAEKSMTKSNRFFYFIMFALAMAFTSCSETNDEHDEFANWKERNEAYFTSIYSKAKQAADSGDARWKVIRSYSKKEGSIDSNDYIVVEVLANGAGTASPIYTDSVKIHYSGSLIPTETYPNGMQFDASWTGDYNLATMLPLKGKVNGFVDGFSTALMHMKPGDRWKVYMPYPLAYNKADRDGIPAYSTLIFDLTLAEVW